MWRLKQLVDENAKLRKVVADLSLDKEMLQDVIRRKLRGLPGGARWWTLHGLDRSPSSGPISMQQAVKRAKIAPSAVLVED
jgi:hypothetical protein